MIHNSAVKKIPAKTKKFGRLDPIRTTMPLFQYSSQFFLSAIAIVKCYSSHLQEKTIEASQGSEFLRDYSVVYGGRDRGPSFFSCPIGGPI
jgi:hypothetical protein